MCYNLFDKALGIGDTSLSPYPYKGCLLHGMQEAEKVKATVEEREDVIPSRGITGTDRELEDHFKEGEAEVAERPAKVQPTFKYHMCSVVCRHGMMKTLVMLSLCPSFITAHIAWESRSI